MRVIRILIAFLFAAARRIRVWRYENQPCLPPQALSLGAKHQHIDQRNDEQWLTDGGHLGPED